MIQLHGVSPLDNISSANSNNASGNQSTGAFQSQLSAAISATLEQFGVDPSQVNITIGPATNSTSTTNPSSTLTGFAAIAAAIAPPNSTPIGTAAPATTDSTPEAPTDPLQSFDNAYWSKQPAAVQALRNMDDPTQRAFQAADLAASGYSIDVPIMVWGWDPSKVTDLREEFGYKWVPSAMQAPIEQAPGIVGFGQPYNPDSPPSGSIAV